jgi:very-short-patch-repair endonuclease
MTRAEAILWNHLRSAERAPAKFRRQHPIGPFIADFACVSARVVIEVDGATHGTDAELAHDRRRDAYLRARKWRVLRVSNEDVYKNLSGVLELIYAEVPPPPLRGTSPVNGGG